MALCLHVGHGKTGSSALQSWLSLSAAELWTKHRIRYPETSPISGSEETEARQLRFSMGNGFILHEILESTDPQAALRALAGDLGSGGKLLFSREALMKELPGRLEELVRLAHAADLGELRLLLFVRDPLEHACSLYGQMVKAHGWGETISEWLPVYNLHEAIERFLEAVAGTEGCCLTVHNYSRDPAAIFRQLGQWLGGPAGLDGLPPPPQNKVNRTLCEDELRLMLLLNRRHGRGAAPIGRSLVNRPPAPHASPYRVPVEAQYAFLERLEPSVARINAHLPREAAMRLQLLPSHRSTLAPEPLAEDGVPLRLLPQQLAVVLEGLGAATGGAGGD